MESIIPGDWIDTAWLLTVLDNSLDEVYFIDCSTERFWHANQTALTNLQHDMNTLLRLSPLDISVDLTAEQWNAYLQPLRDGAVDSISYETRHWRRDGSYYPISFRIFRSPPHSAPVYIAIGTDISVARATARALLISQSRYQAIVANIPSLVFQFKRHGDDSIRFLYLSERCEDLLGVSAEQLQIHPDLFSEMIMADDRDSFKQALDASNTLQPSLNWQGKIWIANWQDIKWISIRATARRADDGSTAWDGVITNITHTKQEELEIKRSHAQLAEFSAHIQVLKEQERTRIAREIHDDLGGNLTAIKMALALVKRRCNSDEASLEKVGYAEHLVDRTIESIHRISGDLRPSVLDFGIVAGIDWQAQEFERLTSIACHLVSEQEDIELSSDQATALFRIFQEALTNISKHACATEVVVELKLDGKDVVLDIADNGKGMQLSEQLKTNSFGIRGMNERVDMLQGSLSINSAPNLGTKLSIRIPMDIK